MEQTLTPEQKGKEARVEMKRPFSNTAGSGRTRANYVILLVDYEEERGDSLSGNGNLLDQFQLQMSRFKASGL